MSLFDDKERKQAVIEYCETRVREDLAEKCQTTEMKAMIKDIYLKQVDYTMNFQRRRWTQVTVFMALVTAVTAILIKMYEVEGKLITGLIGIISVGLLVSWARMFLYTSTEMLMHFAMLREIETYLPTSIYKWDRELYKLTNHPSNTKLERELAFAVLIVIFIFSIVLFVWGFVDEVKPATSNHATLILDWFS